jgi:four helix bundle protein
MKESLLRTKSFEFAIRIVNLYRHLSGSKKEYIIAKQVAKSGTSVGAMIREAQYGESKSDFVHKLAIAPKEINETIYWLELAQATGYISEQEFESINKDAVELIKLITSSIKTAKLITNH